MPNEESSDVRIARLEEKLDFLTEAINKLTLKFDDVIHTFVPRSEFDQLSIIVKGVANDGGLLKRVDKLEKKFIYYAGVAFIVGTLILGGWQYFLARLSSTEFKGNTTTNTTTNNTSK